jgi:hypothetical protein
MRIASSTWPDQLASHWELANRADITRSPLSVTSGPGLLSCPSPHNSADIIGAMGELKGVSEPVRVFAVRAE